MDSWTMSEVLTDAEQRVVKLCKKQPLWRFFRLYQHLILDEEMRAVIHAMYTQEGPGRPPELPERQALALLLQVATGVSDQDVPLLTAVDQRWQMVLGCLGAIEPVLSQGTVHAFRERARKHGLMRRLLDKTVEVARNTRGFSHKRLRALIDASPLVGAGRVEDTINLLGHSLQDLLMIVAVLAEQEPAALAERLQVTVAQGRSVKAALDLDWRLPDAQTTALQELLGQFERIQSFLQKHIDQTRRDTPKLHDALSTVQRVIEQDTEAVEDASSEEDVDEESEGPRKIRKGVSKDRLISLSDRDMRHGRKSKSKSFAGYRRHISSDADISGLIAAVHATAANVPEKEAAKPLLEHLEERFELAGLNIDRGYLSAEAVVALHERGVEVISKPPTSRRSERYSKAAFTPDFEQGTLTCPAGQVRPMAAGQTVRFPTKTCHRCVLRDQCIAADAKQGRHVSMHAQEQWYREMSEELTTSEGRAKRRERTPVEHALARVAKIQGHKARYRGLEKNQFHLEAVAVVNNFYVLDGLFAERRAA